MRSSWEALCRAQYSRERETKAWKTERERERDDVWQRLGPTPRIISFIWGGQLKCHYSPDGGWKHLYWWLQKMSPAEKKLVCGSVNDPTDCNTLTQQSFAATTSVTRLPRSFSLSLPRQSYYCFMTYFKKAFVLRLILCSHSEDAK